MKPSDVWQYEKIKYLESELKKRDELLREAVFFVEYAEKDRYQNTFFTYFLNKPEVKKILEKK